MLPSGPALSLEIQSPAAGGVSYNDPLVLDLRDLDGALSDSDGQGLSLDGRPITARRKQPGLPGQWIAELPALSKGEHRLSFRQGTQPEHLFSHRSQTPMQRVLALADATVSRFEPESLDWDWGEGLLLYALARLDAHLGSRRYQSYIERYYAHHLKVGLPEIDWSDKCAPGLAALEMLKRTDEPAYREIAEKIVSYLQTTPRTSTGALNHLGTWWPSAVYPKSLWVDSLMMYGIFAARWADYTRQPELGDVSAEQAQIFGRHLQHQQGLWKHAWMIEAGHWVPEQEIFWLRGNGWVMAGLPEILAVLPQNHPARPELITRFQHTAQALLYWQDRTGLWHTLVNRPGEIYLETSGTALTAYGLFEGIHRGWLPRHQLAAAEKAYFGVLERLETQADGRLSMPGISDGTMPYETLGYSLIPLRSDKPYGLAALILAGMAHDRLSTQP